MLRTGPLQVDRLLPAETGPGPQNRENLVEVKSFSYRTVSPLRLLLSPEGWKHVDLARPSMSPNRSGRLNPPENGPLPGGS